MAIFLKSKDTGMTSFTQDKYNSRIHEVSKMRPG